jgi:hypothetical protein
MDIPTELMALVIVMIVAAFVAQPFFARGADGPARSAKRTAAALRQKADLLAERNRIYAAIRDLDFDYKTNKVADEDYAAQRHRLVAQGVEVLQKLDSLPALDESPEADPIEAALLALRAGGSVGAALAGAEAAQPGEQAGFCPQCGAPYQRSDRFCGVCGAKLHGKA